MKWWLSFIFLVLWGIVGTAWAYADCEGLGELEQSFCQALKVVEFGGHCQTLKEGPARKTYMNCLLLKNLVQGASCQSFERETVVNQLDERIGVFCTQLQKGYLGESCDAGLLPPLLKKDARSLRASQYYSTRDPKIYYKFGQYIKHNHFKFNERYKRNQLKKDIKEHFKSLNPNFDETIFLLAMRVYPTFSSYAESPVSIQQFLIFLSDLVDFVESNRAMIFTRVSTSTQMGLFKIGTQMRGGRILPATIQIDDQDQVVVDLREIKIDDKIYKSKPIGKGSFKSVFLAFDYLSGNLLIKKLIQSNEALLQVLETVEREKQLQFRIDQMNSEGFLFPLLSQIDVREITIVDVDRYYPYTLKRFHKEILDNPELHTIEGRSKEKIQIDVAVQLLLRLNQMHAAGIHHRDIKPANILIQLDHKGFPQVRIIDFGVAMDSSNVVMTDHDARGAPLYWDPAYVRAFRDAALVGERVQQLDYGLQADLWALGLTLWEWSSGKNLRSPKTVFPIAFIETYEQLQSTLGVDWDMEKVQDPTQLASVIYQMLNPDVKQRKKFNTQSALDQVIQIQKFQNSLEDPGFAFSGVF